MNNLAVIEQYKETGIISGTIKIVGKEFFWVEIGGGLQKLQKASSCLIEPEINDKVLVFMEPDGDNYILSVLSRQSQTPSTVAFENGVSIKVNKGVFNVESPDIQLLAKNTLKLSSRNMDTLADRWIQKVKRSYRTVEEFEESKIGRLRCLVKGMFFVKSEKTTLLSEKAVKIDGDKILLG